MSGPERKLVRYVNRVGRDRRGATLVLVALCLVVLMGAAALCLDVGQLYQVRREMVTAADAAALAAAQELILTANNQDAAEECAIKYAEDYNGAQRCVVSFDVYYEGRAVTGVTVTTYRNVAPVFASVLGIGSSNVSAKATAVLAFPTKYSGEIWPFMYILGPDAEIEEDTSVQVVYCKDGGNWGMLGHDATEVNGALSGTDPMYISEVTDEDGNLIYSDTTMPGDAMSRVNALEIRMKASDTEEEMTGLVPVIEYYIDYEGRTDVVIRGFAWFTITDIIDPTAGGSGWWRDGDNNKNYYARGSEYAQSAFQGRDDAQDRYLYGVKGFSGFNDAGPTNIEDYPGFPDSPTMTDHYPNGAIIGRFKDTNIIRDLSSVLGADPDPDFDFNAVVVKLVE